MFYLFFFLNEYLLFLLLQISYVVLFSTRTTLLQKERTFSWLEKNLNKYLNPKLTLFLKKQPF